MDKNNPVLTPANGPEQDKCALCELPVVMSPDAWERHPATPAVRTGAWCPIILQCSADGLRGTKIGEYRLEVARAMDVGARAGM